MTNYREILRLSSLGYSQRSIESSVRSSHQTVKFALERAKELSISLMMISPMKCSMKCL